MAMHQQMRRSGCLNVQITAKFQQLLDMKRLRRLQPGLVFDNIMEPQFELGVFTVSTEHLRRRPFRVQYGKHVRNFGGAMQVQLSKSAYGYFKGQRHGVQLTRRI